MGAVPEGTTVEVEIRPADAAPVEVDSAAARPFYEITPTDVAFAEPVTVTRTIVLADVGIDPTAGGGLPTAVTAIHDGAGGWRWRDGQLERYEYGGPELLLIARTDSGGQLFPVIAGALRLAPDEGLVGTVGELFTLEAVLAAAPDSESIASASSAVTDALNILAPEGVNDFDFLGSQANSHQARCLAPGPSGLDANYRIASMADTHPVTIAAGLDGSDLAVQVHLDITCEG